MTKPQEGNTNLRRFDLNLLPVLKVLLSTHSVARSSEILNLSQSATSSSLSRLRAMFGDPLLVIVGRNLVPTAKALELKPFVDEAFASLYDVFDQRDFDPQKEERRFLVATTDFVVDELSMWLLELLAEQAPRISVRFVEVTSATQSLVESGDIDFIITPYPESDPFEHVEILSLYDDKMVVISSEGFQGAVDVLDAKTYFEARHVAYGVADNQTLLDQALADLGRSTNTIMTVAQFNLIPKLIHQSDCLAIVPGCVAERHRKAYGLRTWPVPFPIPLLHVSLIWSHLLSNSPAHIWFRELLVTGMKKGQPA